MSEARTDRLEARLGHIEETAVRIEATLAATLPHLATKAELANLRGELAGGTNRLRSDVTSEIGKLRAELADKPSRLYLWAAMVGSRR
jgi:hypothetical protein